jgi:hypothetical protein
MTLKINSFLFFNNLVAIIAALLLAQAPILAQKSSTILTAQAHEQAEKYTTTFANELESTEIAPMSQFTSVNQLQDVSPTDWAYEALRNLVERYGCIGGYPNQTYRGNRPLSRYEFAAGLNACLNHIQKLIASSEVVARVDVETLQRLMREFETELASIRGRVDNVEDKLAVLEDSNFSTTTKLQGEVAFTLAQAFGDDTDAQVVLNERIRLQLVTSFTGRDRLFTRLTGGNIGNSFQDEIGTREGRFAFDGQSDNDIVLDRLHYVFPIGNNLQVTVMASLAAHHFYTEVFNDGLNAGGGATGALSRFAERSPIYRQGLDTSSSGLGLRYNINDNIEIYAGYIAPNGSDPDESNGLFNGSYSALGQVVFKPIDRLKLGLTYVRGYDTTPFRGSFLWGGTGTNLGNLRLTSANGISVGGVPVNVAENPVTTNSFGGQFQWDITSRISLRGWFSYTDANLNDVGEAEILNYAGAIVFPDLGTEGSLGAIIVGAEPYLNDLELDSGVEPDFPDDIPLHVEAFYKYQLNDNISLTPGIIWLVSPNQNNDNDSVVIGAIRTTFTF